VILHPLFPSGYGVGDAWVAGQRVVHQMVVRRSRDNKRYSESTDDEARTSHDSPF
jgi:hypothetical protein